MDFKEKVKSGERREEVGFGIFTESKMSGQSDNPDGKLSEQAPFVVPFLLFFFSSTGI
jgi:hypothetical protein